MRRISAASLVVWLAVGCAGTTPVPNINGARIQAADSEPQSWLAHGRTYSEQRFSPLARLTPANVGQLGLAWSHDIAKTWFGEWWKYGGGGTVWDSMAYDPALDLLYIGVGNGGPWNYKMRSDGKGDNLFLASIVALRPDTGEYVWHFQTTPAEDWDYTATQHMILADLTIDGRARKVLMQAPPNGFFYVLDRVTGEFISGTPYVNVTWASGVDPRTGRPIEKPEARYSTTGKPLLVQPGPIGGHNWQPMSYSPTTGLVYLPAIEGAFFYVAADPTTFQRRPGVFWNTGLNPASSTLPDDEAVRKAIRASAKGRLIAWDPVQRKPAWEAVFPIGWNGGTLATAGGLVF